MSAVTNLFAFSLTVLFILLLRPLATWLGIVDHPGGRKWHEHSTPVVGGLGFFLGLVVTLVRFQVAIPSPIAYFGAAILLAVTGLLDDRFDLPARLRLLVQVAAALIMTLGGGLVVGDFGDCFGMRLDLGPLAIPFTVFATVGLINAFNMLDGIDGLAGMVSISMLAVLGPWAQFAGATEVANLAYLLLFAVSGFLLFNLRLTRRRCASVFMGDAGSMVLGLSFAWMVVALTQDHYGGVAPMAAFWLVAFPIMETANVMIRRKRERQSIFRPDHEHLHYILWERGLSINRTVLLISSIALAMAGFGVVGGFLKSPDWLMALALLLTGILYYRIVDNVTLNRENATDCPEKKTAERQGV